MNSKNKVMQMKKTGIILAAILIVAMTIPGSLAAVSKFPQVVVTLINQEPDPVAPGNSFDVRFRIENEGSDPAQDVEVKLNLEYPLSVYGDGENNNQKNIGTVGKSSNAEDIGVVEKWTLQADPNAATGESQIEFWYRVNKGVWTKAGDYTVTIRSGNAFLAINNIDTKPDKIVPGTTTTVEFTVENTANNELRDVTLDLGIYTAVTTASGVSVSELPFTPIGSGNEKTLSRIPRGQQSKISFDLFTDADATSKVYKVPYVLTYSDTSGANFTRTGVLGLVVESEPELSVYVEDSDVLSAGQTGKVSVKIVNKGFSDVKFLDAKLKEGTDFELLSTPEVYIGKIDSDDYETADYTIHVSSSAKDSVQLPLSIDYRDANGNLYTKQIPLTLRLYTDEQLKQKNGQTSNPMITILIAVVLVAAAVFLIRRYRKPSRK